MQEFSGAVERNRHVVVEDSDRDQLGGLPGRIRRAAESMIDSRFERLGDPCRMTQSR